MYFLFSGEGPTDMGVGTGAAVICEGEDYLSGPMAVIIDQIVEHHPRHQYSPLDSQCCGFVSELQLVARAVELKAAKKSLGLPGFRQRKETRYFFNNARVLARIAKEEQDRRPDEEVVAVLFRDCDGTASAGRGLWDNKHDSMLHGFQQERFARGVPMLAKPKSEAWLIAGITGAPNHEGMPLEQWSGNNNAPRPLKAALAELIGQPPSRQVLCELMRDGTVDYQRIHLPKFDVFQARLQSFLD